MNYIKKLLIYSIQRYQKYISPIIPYNSCRFYPSCSEYMIQSVNKHGILKGFTKGLWRIVRCNPFNTCKEHVDMP